MIQKDLLGQEEGRSPEVTQPNLASAPDLPTPALREQTLQGSGSKKA